MATMQIVGVPMVQHVIDKQLITDAFERLGYDRVLRAHVALAHGNGGDWHNCFLAMAYGGYGKLYECLPPVSPDVSYDVAQILDLTVREVWAVTEAFDHCLTEFQILVEEWLELNKNPALVLRDLAIRAYGRENVDLESFAKAAAYCDQPEIKMQLAGVR